MATYAIGDVQGCFDTLQRLLETIAFDPTKDELWLAGDLVNRGPGSLGALRFVYANRNAIKLVLGNHDLHLLGRVAKVRRAGRRDTLDDVLAAPDLEELVDWFRRQPLVVAEGNRLMVHAGLLPSWSAEEAVQRSKEVEAVLSGDEWTTLLSSMFSKSRKPQPYPREQETIKVMTLLRIIDAQQRPMYEFKHAPEDAPDGHVPWFKAPDRLTADRLVLFGHWAALGYHATPNAIGLDSGCVWGHQLTAVRLDDRAVFQVPNSETHTV